jgi:predicted nucleotidyltransferase
MEIVKNVGRWGNSAGILLPREWLGNQVRVVLIDRTLEIKKEVLEILSDYLGDIIGIYLVGSYARGEQEKDSDIDIIAISKSLKKEIKSGKYHISITTLDGVKTTLKSNPELILPRLAEAKYILNSSLVEDLLKEKINKKSFKNFVEDTIRIIKINKEFIEMDKLDGKKLESENVIYSLILRLRGLFLIKCFLKKEKYLKKSFRGWLLKSIDEKEFEETYDLYKTIRDGKKPKVNIFENIKIKTAERLLNYLEKEIKFLES